MRTIDRRRTIQMLGALLGAGCGHSIGAQSWPTPAAQPTSGSKPVPGKGPTGDPQAPLSGRGGLRAFKAEGCAFSGYGTDGAGRPQLSYYSGSAAIDAMWDSEGKHLIRVFSVTPAGGFLNDSGGPNAFATPERYYKNGPDGTVMFGVNLMQSELMRENRGITIHAITAHEFGHIRQIKDGRLLSVHTKWRELHADYLAGWYMGVRNQFENVDLAPVLQSFFSKGDYNFTSENHHGTPDERVKALQAGINDRRQSISVAFDNGMQFLRI